jgi:hypothetical protein
MQVFLNKILVLLFIGMGIFTYSQEQDNKKVFEIFENRVLLLSFLIF